MEKVLLVFTVTYKKCAKIYVQAIDKKCKDKWGLKMIKTINKLEEVIDFAWELSKDDLKASYPRRRSIKEVREVIERAISSDNRNIIGYYKEDVLCGLCIYYFEFEEKHSSTELFLINEAYEKIAEEFIGYIGDKLPGCKLLIGVPSSNENANEFFKKNNIECVDSSIDTRLYNLKPSMNKKHENVEKITDSSFEEYALFHDKYAIPIGMYYNSKNIKKYIDQFQIFAFRQGGEIHGSIFVKTLKDPREKEVFGLFIDEEYKNKGIEGILINEMLMQLYNDFGSLKEVVYFIEEDSTEELNSALAAGFEIKDKYRCYKCLL